MLGRVPGLAFSPRARGVFGMAGPGVIDELSTAYKIPIDFEKATRRNHLAAMVCVKRQMLHKTSSAVVDCLQRASECERLAKTAIDPDARERFIRMATHWRSLAENRQYLERMEACLTAK